MKKNLGITLIALVITIVVLLILAGVALSLVAGNEGILSKAETAASQTNFAVAREQAELLFAELSADYYEARYVNKESSVRDQKINAYIVGRIGTQGMTIADGEYVVKVDGENITVLNNVGTIILTGKLAENGKAAWDEVVNDSGDNSGENAGGDSNDDSGSSEVNTSVTLSDDYGHSYTVTEAGKYYFYSYTYGHNFMSVFDVTEGDSGLQAKKQGEYSLETGRTRTDEPLTNPNSTFFNGMTCLSSEGELTTTKEVESIANWNDIKFGAAGFLTFKLAQGYYYHEVECGFRTFVVDENFQITILASSTTELQYCGNQIDEWVNLEELCISGASS